MLSASAIIRPAGRPGLTTAVAALVGAVGSALVAWSSYVVGTPPGPRIDKVAAVGPYRWPYEIGVALLVVAWLVLGRLVLDPRVTGMTRRLWWAGAAMAAPLLLSAPVTSQDVWAYLGQANVAAHHLNPYALGPSSVPGPFANAVAEEYVSAPSPYGPLWMGICRTVVYLVHPHPWAGMYLLRVLAFAGVAALGLALARLCRATGTRPEVAWWLALAGPFSFLMMLGALHNECVMLALLVGGVAAAASVRSMWRALLLGAALVGLAASIKVTALVAAPFLPLVWHRYAAAHAPDGRRPLGVARWVATGAASVLAAVVTVLVCSLVFGFDLGWVHQVGDGRVGVQWLSVSQQIGNLYHLVAPHRISAHRRNRWWLVHPVALGFMALALVLVTLTARRRPPLHTMAWVLLVPVIANPAPRTWYLLWPLMFLAVDRMPRWLFASVVAGAATLALWYPPSVRPAVPQWVLLALFLPLVGLVLLLVRDLPVGARSGTPDPGRS